MKKGLNYLIYTISFIYIFVMLSIVPYLDLSTNKDVKIGKYQKTQIVNYIQPEKAALIGQIGSVPKIEIVKPEPVKPVVVSKPVVSKPTPVKTTFQKTTPTPSKPQTSTTPPAPSTQTVSAKESIEDKFNLGTIKISNSDFNRRVIKDDGTYYYLNHDLNGKYDNVGMPIIDFRTNFKTRKTIIYAHSATNGKSPFNYLQNYHNNKAFYEAHKNISIIYEGHIYNYEIFSVYVSLADDDLSEGLEYYRNIYYEDDEWGKILNWYKSNSEYDTGVNVSSNDKILIFQTCSMDNKYRGKYYRANLLVMARLVEAY